MSSEFSSDLQVVVTGAGSGIGLAVADVLSSKSAFVTGLDINGLPKRADVTDRNSLEAAVTNLQNVGLLVIGAGVTSEDNYPDDDIKHQIKAVNIEGVRNTLEVLKPHLRDGATIIFIGSDKPPKDFYAETKRQAAKIVEAFARQNPNYRYVIILAGPVDTPLFRQGKTPEIIEQINKHTPIFTPREFAQQLLKLLQELEIGKGEVRVVELYKDARDVENATTEPIVSQNMELGIQVMRNVGTWMVGSGLEPSQWWQPQNMNSDFLLQHTEPDEYFVAMIDNQPAASVVLQETDRNQSWRSVDGDTPQSALYVHWLCVHRNFAGQGLAAKMIEFAEQEAQQRGFTRLRLDTNADEKKLCALYEGLGFQLIRTEDDDDHRVAFYEKRL